MKTRMFIVEKKDRNYSIPVDEVMYIKSSEDHQLELFTKSRVISFYGTLNAIENQDKYFFRAHRSYLINLENIREVDKKNRLVHFHKNLQCPFSRRNSRELIEKIKALN